MNASYWIGWVVVEVAFCATVFVAYRAGMAAERDSAAEDALVGKIDTATVTHAAALRDAYQRGAEDGAELQLNRAYAKRSAAGKQAAVTRRNRVTGEERDAMSPSVTWVPARKIDGVLANLATPEPDDYGPVVVPEIDAPGRAD